MSLHYGPHEDHVADLFLPIPDGTPAPLILFWHGGFWRAKHDRHHVRPLVDDLVARGYAVANIEYRRVGTGGGWPTTLEDTALAVDTLPALVEELHPGRVDHARTVYAGHSAGGHLALWAALRDRLPAGAPGRLPHTPPAAGALALAPVLNLVEAYRAAEGSGVGAVHDFLGGGPAEYPDRYAATDPTLLGSPSIPVTIAHGTLDASVSVEASRVYTGTTKAELLELPATAHFDVIDPNAAAWPEIVAALAALAAA
ncbi:alpha/beta hydrolase [Yinghuangia seranimata]|uniref:alpha/beta hydrolase n=1 Tax=Yinghuangia seranimata TaxID=408067 RepID=UPI00248C2B38|nr:alpha/beta hydrolase [Yinghuangia seranimata]MDI2129584.1 alpha/beta hydrolase [Yinghuangia seranimata]